MFPLPLIFQTFYALAAATILLVSSIPALQRRFIAYGKTSASISTPTTPASPLSKLLDATASPTVPHHYFTHFYILALASAGFWGYQVVTRGAAYQLVNGGGGGMAIEQVILAWLCFLGQAGRRLYECLYVQKLGGGGGSRMWVLHYVVGLLFYLVMSISVWVEGTSAINSFTFTPSSVKALINAPSFKTFVGLIGFFFASGMQHDCHAHLASLRKYSLPSHPFFQSLVCPHYSAECAIYIAIAVVAAPKGSIINLTVGSGLVFVAVNLGVSAKVNREWYQKMFGNNAVKDKWNMIPGIF